MTETDLAPAPSGARGRDQIAIRRPHSPQTPSGARGRAAPIVHPMDPRRGENLSPEFGAVLCWLLGLPPLVTPSIAGIVVNGDCVHAATADDPFHNTYLGSWTDLESNLRRWGKACDADPDLVDTLVDRVRRASK